MLSFRTLVFAGVAGFALWGLFALLDKLNEPALLRSEKTRIVKGCDKLDSDRTRQECPALICQKAVLDRNLAPPTAELNVTVDQTAGERRLIGGTIAGGDHFACVVRGIQIVNAHALTQQALDGLAARPDTWPSTP